MNPGDIHIMISHAQKVAQAYDHTGVKVFRIDALTHGVGGGVDAHAGDTPAGDYRATGLVQTTDADTSATWAAYGPWFVALDDLEGQERSRSRAGIGMHGGGTGLPDPQANRQDLIPTCGCIRIHNHDLATLIVPLVKHALANGLEFLVTVGP